MQSTVLAPEPQLDESLPARNLAAPASLVAASASLGVSLLTDATMLAGGLAALAIVLAVRAFTKARGNRGRLLTAGLAVTVALGSIVALLLPTDSPATSAPTATAVDSVLSEVPDSPVQLAVGASTINAETESTSVLVTVTNISDHPVSTWASLSATSPSGKKQYAAQGVGVKDLAPGASSTQQIQFGAILPEKAVFVVKDVL